MLLLGHLGCLVVMVTVMVVVVGGMNHNQLLWLLVSTIQQAGLWAVAAAAVAAGWMPVLVVLADHMSCDGCDLRVRHK